MLWLVKRLSASIDMLRENGMEAPRASTLNEHCWKIIDNFGILRRIKEYSTPYAMKSFSKL